MPNEMDGCIAKVERAGELIASLNADIEGMLSSGLYSVVSQDQPEKKRHAFWVEGPPVPNKVSIVAGEVIHHLRSVFDHFIWALIAKNGGTARLRSHFPVYDTQEKYSKAIKDGAIRGVPRSIYPLIDAMQPFRTRDPQNSLLKAIHDLDIADKHRLLVVTAAAIQPGTEIRIAAMSPGMSIRLPAAIPGATPFHTAIEDGKEVNFIVYDGPDGAKMEIQNDATVKIVFKNIGSQSDCAVIQTLESYYDYTNHMVGEFQKFFV